MICKSIPTQKMIYRKCNHSFSLHNFKCIFRLIFSALYFFKCRSCNLSTRFFFIRTTLQEQWVLHWPKIKNSLSGGWKNLTIYVRNVHSKKDTEAPFPIFCLKDTVLLSLQITFKLKLYYSYSKYFNLHLHLHTCNIYLVKSTNKVICLFWINPEGSQRVSLANCLLREIRTLNISGLFRQTLFLFWCLWKRLSIVQTVQVPTLWKNSESHF